MSPVSPRRMHRSFGFTLIELLVVVAIIALLISILLPSLSRARNVARSTACLAIQKQLGNANIMYADANDDWYVYYNETTTPKRITVAAGGFWGANIAYRTILGLPSVAAVAGQPGTGQSTIVGLMDPAAPQDFVARGEWHLTFSMQHQGAGVAAARSIKRSKVVIPADKVMGTDATSWNIDNSAQTDPQWWDTFGDTRVNAPPHNRHTAYRHLEMTNMVMHDGHAQTFTKHEAFNPVHNLRIKLYDPYKFWGP